MTREPPIFHLFKFLADNREKIASTENIADVMSGYDKAAHNETAFPDMIIEPNAIKGFGGMLVECKSSKTYNISSFNSTMPTSKKDIRNIKRNKNIARYLEACENTKSTYEWDVYYLIMGRDEKRDGLKLVLVYGGFFETLSSKNSIGKIILQMIQKMGISLNKADKKRIRTMDQKALNKIMQVDRSSIKFRLRMMNEARCKVNLLSSSAYPEIMDNTINLCLPCKDKQEKRRIIKRAGAELGNVYKQINIKHRIDGSRYMVFQIPLSP